MGFSPLMRDTKRMPSDQHLSPKTAQGNLPLNWLPGKPLNAKVFDWGKSLYLCRQLYTQKTAMNKAELASKLAEDTGLTKVQTTAAIESFMEGVTKALRSGKKVTLVGFGTFSVTKRAGRKGRNPATGESIKIKAKKVVKFRAGKELSSKL